MLWKFLEETSQKFTPRNQPEVKITSYSKLLLSLDMLIVYVATFCGLGCSFNCCGQSGPKWWVLRLSALVSDSSKPHLAKNLTTLSQKTHASCSINCLKNKITMNIGSIEHYTIHTKKKKNLFIFSLLSSSYYFK